MLVTTPRPFGLGQREYEAFRLLLASKVGEERLGRLIVDEAQQGARTDLEGGTSGTMCLKSAESEREVRKRRAINRAPEPIQQLYDAGLLRSDYAAKFGPNQADDAAKSDLARKAAELAEKAKELDATLPEPQRKRHACGGSRRLSFPRVCSGYRLLHLVG